MLEDKILVFGGPYSNLQATQKMYEITVELGFEPSQIICTGDVVGYCAQPQETIDLVKSWGIHWLAGNVEQQLATGAEDCGCNFDEGSRCSNFSQTWFPYAQIHVSENAKEEMKTLPENLVLEISGYKVGVVHGGLDDISQFIFKSTSPEVKEEILDRLGVDIVVAGHSGIPFHQRLEKGLWVNAGVIGMPANDGQQEVWFAIVDLKTKTVEHRSFSYDWKTAKALMEQANLPAAYSKTLETGLWDNMEILPEQEKLERGKPMIFEA
ncbi:Calcineurin-like phosphoesterase superfamily domain-containing protein [Lishizhenia tianjinensis]|uniref:Calcineurin-like phosphoesterase superfamily domain-containing protein n=1 Tax=Lishizhenia tianjinensis TaxID=477690 RepID=A0A1I6XG15_9FLAO|nr:metallophosphoesterase family protein [Lishizhenia tianjinensis]SFT36962.1 Calcineurin-like phosphoesterase superfamily domain-containing protein [Lishizhenia tianjinensis]